MYKYVVGFIAGLILCGVSNAALIPTPRPVEDKEVLLYLRRIQGVLGKIEVVTTDPNGNRLGIIGDVVIFNNSGTFSIETCTDSGPAGGTTWVGTGALS